MHFPNLRVLVLSTASTLAATWCIGASPPGGMDCQIEGVVRGQKARPLEEASITLLPAGIDVRTDHAGRFCIETTTPGPQTLLVVADGHRIEEHPIEVHEGHRTEIDLQLRPAFGEEMVVTSSQTRQRLVDVPIHLEVIDRTSIESTVARTLAEIVEWTPGIRVENNCQNCNVSKIRLLGLEGPYSQLLIDGQPTVSSVALVYGIEQIPARLIDSVEVVKGSGSALYGAGAVAGVLNMIPHQATHRHTVVDARYSQIGGESATSLAAVADWASVDRSRLLTAFLQSDSIHAVDIDGDGFSDVSERDLDTLGARYDHYLPNSRGRWTAEANFIDEHRRGGDRLDLPPHEALVAESIDSRRTGASLRWLHTPGSTWDMRWAASWSRTERDSYYGAGRDPNAYGTTDNPMLVLDGQFHRYEDAGTWTWGVQWQRDEVDDVQLGYDRRIEETHEDLGLFAQAEHTFGQFTLLAGTRVDDHSAVADPVFSPRAALMWAPRSNVTIRTSLGRGFRPPVVFDEDLHVALLGGGSFQIIRNAPDLAEETSTSGLMSLEWRPLVGRKGSASLGIDLFRTDLEDLFHVREDDDPATGVFEFTRENFGDARVQGIELAASVRWGSRWTLDAGYVLQSARFEQPDPDFGSRRMFRTPEWTATLSARVQLPRRVELFLGLRGTGSMEVPHYAGFITADRLETSPTFVTVDLNLSRSFPLPGTGHAIELTLGGRNLGDAFQDDLDQGPLRDAAYVVGPRYPRSVFAQIQVDW